MKLYKSRNRLALAALIGSTAACRPSAEPAERAPAPAANVTPAAAASIAPSNAIPAVAPAVAAPAPARAQPGRWGKLAVRASAGCTAAAAGAAGARTLSVNGADRRFIVSLPPGYDPATPYPLVFGFHGRTRTHEECRDVDCRGLQALFGDTSILVYMKSLNAGWRDEGQGFSNNDAFFDAVLALAKSAYCVDESRVVVSGTSSGAMFANQVACRHGSAVAAVFPVGGAIENTAACERPIPAVVLHGIDDSHVVFARGEASRDFYRKRNGCSEQTQPNLAEAHQAVRAERAAGQETFRCVDYVGCQPGLPVRWCEHGEGGWDNSTHAWPTFGGGILKDFLNTL